MHAVIAGRRLLIAAGLTLASGFVHAAPPAPPTPGAIGETLKQPPALQPPPPAPQIGAPERQAPTAPARGATLTVSHFVFSGNTLYSQDELAGLIADYLNKPITLAQVYEAADKVSDFYVRHGYSLASVTVPAQKVKDGTIRLEVIEGRVGKIGFEGNSRYHDGLLRGFVSHTHPDQVYQSAPLEKDLQTLNSLPGLAARAVIQPGTDYGTSDVMVKVQEDPIDGYAVLDNYGRKDSGQYRVSASVTVNNPFEVADQLQVLGTHADANLLNYGYVDYNVPIGYGGLRFDANYGHAYFKTPAFLTSGKNNNLQLSLMQPFWRTPVDQLTASAGLIHTDANALLSGVPIPGTSANVNLLNLGATYSHIWSNSAVTQYIGSLHTNFNQSDAGDLNRRERLRLEINAQHLQPLPWWKLQALAQVDGVYSPDPLVDTEQFSIGGPTSIRGFPASEARGDRGFFGQFTLRRPFAAGPVSLVPRIYADSGRVKTLGFAPTPDTSNSLTSAGLGSDVIYRTLDLKVDWAYPLDSRPVSDGRDHGRVYAALTAGF
ncbi:MAG: ShlB/FhaC/HecB family hemolysin secretion/activation protein [Nevskia sp.]|nr:ShlB/FhaC/HecB family hemolysin secretion/activation protein [Nevskia sp.]